MVSTVWFAAPQSDGSDLAIATLARIRLASHLVFFGEPGVKNPTEVHVTRVTACPDDDTSFRPNVDGPALIGSRNTDNPP
jgi:hypothetical protein